MRQAADGTNDKNMLERLLNALDQDDAQGPTFDPSAVQAQAHACNPHHTLKRAAAASCSASLELACLQCMHPYVTTQLHPTFRLSRWLCSYIVCMLLLLQGHALLLCSSQSPVWVKL